MENARALFSEREISGGVAVSTFVSVGNATQPFERLLVGVCRLASVFPQPVVVQHGHTPFTCPIGESYAFLDMSAFEALMATAEVLILHAGAGSVLNAIRAGRVPIIVPRRAALGEHVNDHQLEFARQLAIEGRVLLVEDVEDLGGAVAKAKALTASSRAGMTATPPLVDAIKEVLVRYATRDPG